MKTIVIPVDFTATTDNAVNFAAAWSQQYGYERIILLKSFYDSMFESIAVSEGYANVSQDCLNTDRQVMVKQLNEQCRSLAAKVPNTKVMTAHSEVPLLRAMIEMVEDEKPELVILGSDNYHYSSGSFVSGNAVGIAKASRTRVLIVPANCQYRPVTDALVPCDFNTLTALDKVNLLRTNPYWQDVRLHVLNVDAKGLYLNPDAKFQERENRLHDYLKNFQHEIYYRNDKNVMSGIKGFISEYDVQLIIALPGRHSFLYSLTHNSISEALYRNAQLPVLILK
jgi:nucleotide-binding universal stress UspA family protein